MLKWARTPSFGRVGRAVLQPLDLALRKTGVPPSSIGTGLPIVFLTTTGRKSGKPHTVPVLAVDLPDGVAVIASNWGQQRRPSWFYNLQSNPDCLLQRGRRELPHQAHLATPEEREKLWRRALEVYPPWETYAERVDRDLDFFILEPSP